jgi:tetratricopeptide (TPR) repeat protein
VQNIIWKLVEINKVEEALKLCPMIESNSAKYKSISHIANKMAELGQIKQAIALYNQQLYYAQKDFQDIEDNIRNWLNYLQPLDIFNDLSLEFPIAKDLTVKALELFPDEKARKDFVLYLVKIERFQQAIAIAETLKENSHFLKYMVSRFIEMRRPEEARQILLMFESGQEEFDAYL